MAMVAAIFPGGMQSYYHLVPPAIFAQVLGKPCEVTFGQPFQFLIYFSPLLVGKNTFYPKHDSDLDFQGQYAAKWLILGIDQPSTIHDDSAKHEMGSLCAGPFIHWFLGPITHSRQALGTQPKKVYPWGGTP